MSGRGFKDCKLLAVDMDGTLLGPDSELTEPVIRAVRRAVEGGMHVVPSTGRGMPHLVDFVKRLGLDGPIIAVNGSEVWADSRTLRKRHLLNADLVERLIGMADAYGVWFWGYAVSGVFNRDDRPRDAKREDWLKFGFYTEDDELRGRIADEAAAWRQLEITNSNPCNLEINPLGVTKASGLREVCGLLGVRMDQCAAVGDSLNDLPMIQAAGFGVAMANAQAEVLQAADWVTDSNAEDGVAHLIDRLLELSIQ